MPSQALIMSLKPQVLLASETSLRIVARMCRNPAEGHHEGHHEGVMGKGQLRLWKLMAKLRLWELMTKLRLGELMTKSAFLCSTHFAVHSGVLALAPGWR